MTGDGEGTSKRLVQRPDGGAALRGSRQSKNKNIKKPALGLDCGSWDHMVGGMLEMRPPMKVPGTNHCRHEPQG